MSSPAHAAAGFPSRVNLRMKLVSLLVLAAMAMGYLWASGHDEQRCLELLLLALLVPLMLAGSGPAVQAERMGRPGRYCLFAFFALGAVSSLSAFSLRHALYEWSILLLLLLTAVLLAAELARAGASGMQILLRGVVAIGLLHALRVALIYAAILASGGQADMHVLAVGFSNARFLNHVQTALLPLVVLLTQQMPKGSAWRRASFALAAFWWAFLFLSEARASLLGLGAGCVLAFVVRRAHARGFLKAMALTALAGAAVYVLAFILLPILAGQQPFNAAANMVQRTAADPTSSRTLMWQRCLDLIAAHPWLGIGPYHFAHETSAESWGAHPHDFILQIGAEWGLPALLCMLAAIGLGMRGLVRSAGRIAEADLPNQQTLAVLLATGAAVFVDGLFSGVLVMPESQLAIALYLACAMAWVRSLDSKSAATRASAPSRWSASLLAVAALCALAYGVAPGIVEHASQAPLTAAERAANPETQWPRLWEAGHF